MNSFGGTKDGACLRGRVRDGSPLLSGDARVLMDALVGSGDAPELPVLAAGAGWGQVRDAVTLKEFLVGYCECELPDFELAVIIRAWELASRSAWRELLELDVEVGGQMRARVDAGVPGLVAASRRVGRSQLRRLLPLKDSRLVQRYGEAVESGRAAGWHTVVYGLFLGVFSIPLRSGMQHYGVQAVRGFLAGGASRLGISAVELAAIDQSVVELIPRSIERVLAEGGGAVPVFRVVG